VWLANKVKSFSPPRSHVLHNVPCFLCLFVILSCPRNPGPRLGPGCVDERASGSRRRPTKSLNFRSQKNFNTTSACYFPRRSKLLSREAVCVLLLFLGLVLLVGYNTTWQPAALELKVPANPTWDVVAFFASKPAARRDAWLAQRLSLPAGRGQSLLAEHVPPHTFPSSRVPCVLSISSLPTTHPHHSLPTPLLADHHTTLTGDLEREGGRGD
jgi:hypothetical protein